jgi:23S rRNA (guanosine2251-2'-O)-methyltransferase
VAILVGIHAVLEALRAGRSFDRVVVSKGAGGERIQEVVDLCRSASVPTRFEPRGALDRLAGSAAQFRLVGS